ncbi:MAG: hypothetical protein NT007_06750 [Candidatus Kapabacteria bacterium]|nr:hypothetical protein [Candidatus Kapabacteria bacterium]
MKTSIAVIPAYAGISNCAMEGDSCIRRNDRNVAFETASSAKISPTHLLQRGEFYCTPHPKKGGRGDFTLMQNDLDSILLSSILHSSFGKSP